VRVAEGEAGGRGGGGKQKKKEKTSRRNRTERKRAIVGKSDEFDGIAGTVERMSGKKRLQERRLRKLKGGKERRKGPSGFKQDDTTKDEVERGGEKSGQVQDGSSFKRKDQAISSAGWIGGEAGKGSQGFRRSLMIRKKSTRQ